jgi:hypothetical protein
MSRLLTEESNLHNSETLIHSIKMFKEMYFGKLMKKFVEEVIYSNFRFFFLKPDNKYCDHVTKGICSKSQMILMNQDTCNQRNLYYPNPNKTSFPKIYAYRYLACCVFSLTTQPVVTRSCASSTTRRTLCVRCITSDARARRPRTARVIVRRKLL